MGEVDEHFTRKRAFRSQVLKDRQELVPLACHLPATPTSLSRWQR